MTLTKGPHGGGNTMISLKELHEKHMADKRGLSTVKIQNYMTTKDI